MCSATFQRGDYYDFEGEPHCEIHYHAQRGTLCAQCQKPVTGECSFIHNMYSELGISVTLNLYVCKDLCTRCGFDYTAIYRKTKRATTLVFSMHLRYI